LDFYIFLFLCCYAKNAAGQKGGESGKRSVLKPALQRGRPPQARHTPQDLEWALKDPCGFEPSTVNDLHFDPTSRPDQCFSYYD